MDIPYTKSNVKKAPPAKKEYYKKYPNGIIETNKVIVKYDKEKGNKIVNEFYFLENLGKGTYSKVKKCVNVNTKEEFAVKIINKYLLRKKKKSYGKTKEGTLKITYMIEDALNEIEIYKSFPNMNNNNVLKLYQILNDEVKDKTYLIMELGHFGALVSLDSANAIFHLNNHFDDLTYNEKLIKKWILQISKGLKFLHDNNIVHRDMKSDNIVINKDGDLKIIDFGSAIKIKNGGKDEFTKTEGNVYFFPPEFANGQQNKKFGYKPVDIWCFGVSIYTCIYKTLPFMLDNRDNYLGLFDLINKCEINYNKNNIKISKEMNDLLKLILEKDPNKRITAADIVEYPWLQS